VVGQEQVLHFKNLFAILRLLGFPWAEGCHHVAYGLVNLPRGMGRLKSREGTAVDADQMCDHLHEEARGRIVEGGFCGDDTALVERTAEAIGQGALKVYLLQVGNDKNIVFDPAEKLSFEGDTGPAIQYSHARICGILRKAMERGAVTAEELLIDSTFARGLREDRVDYSRLDTPEERDLALLLLDYPSALSAGLRQLSASPTANYLLDLTRAYARFYHANRVLDAPDAETMRARLHLSLCVATVLRWGLAILTVEAPERM
jgi:arginyl-tRNA synthetase